MRKNIFKIALVLMSAILLYSCDLTREPYNTIPSGSSLESMSDAKKWDTGFMSQLRSRYGGYYFTLQDYQADYLNASADFGNRGGAWYTWTSLNSSDYDVKDIWHSYYYSLKNINEFLELSEKFELTSEDQKAELSLYQGDAHLLRAYYYYELALRYGTVYNKASEANDLCVPLILKYDIAELPSRATNKAVFDQIASDIAKAKTLLAARKNAPMSRVLNTDAAYALEARVALYKKDWPTALTAAEKLINSKTYPLIEPEVENIEDMWRADKSSEDIVQLFIKKNDEEPRTIGYYGWSNSLQLHVPDWFPTQGIIDMFEDGDIRFNLYFEKKTTEVLSTKMEDLYVISKFKGNPAFDTTPGSPLYILAPKIFRMGEIYMIAAESAYMDKKEEVAKKHLNDLRNSRGLDDVNVAGNALFEEIKKERTRELAFEGQRFWDLRRWGDGMTRMSPQESETILTGTDKVGSSFITSMSPIDLKVESSSHRWIWPIPYNEMTTNVNIKDQQNPGWQ